MTNLEVDFRIPLKIKRYIVLPSSYLELENSIFRGETVAVITRQIHLQSLGDMQVGYISPIKLIEWKHENKTYGLPWPGARNTCLSKNNKINVIQLFGRVLHTEKYLTLTLKLRRQYSKDYKISKSELLKDGGSSHLGVILPSLV